MHDDKPPVLVTASLEFLSELKKEIASAYTLHYHYNASRDTIEALLKRIPFRAWLVSPCPTYFLNSALIDLCPDLEIIATPSTGTNHIDCAYVQKKNIALYCLRNTPVVDAIYASSEFTFNLMISTIRNTPFAFDAVRQGIWRESEGLFRGRELRELTLGIIGYGRIGRNLKQYAQAFGMRICCYDPYKTVTDSQCIQYDSLEEMVAVVDVVAVCVHLTEETYHLIDDELFARMREGVYVINTSRGDVVDEEALLRNLQSGKITAAGLDVISDELTGMKTEHPLIQYAKTHSNLIITPHIAGLTYDSERKAQTAAYEAIKKGVKSY